MIDYKKLEGSFVKEKHDQDWLVFFEESNDSFCVDVSGDCLNVSTQQPFQLGGLPIEVCRTFSEDSADLILQALNKLIVQKNEQKK